MIMYWFSFSTILLSSWFLIDMMRGEFQKLSEISVRRWSRGLLIAMAAVSGMALLFSIKGFVVGLMDALTPSLSDPQKRAVFDGNFSRNFLPALWIGWWLFAIAALGLLLGVIRGKVSAPVFLSAIFVMGLVDTVRVDRQFIKTVNPSPYFAAEPVVKQLKAEMAREPFRVYSVPGALQQNGEGVHGLEGVGGFHDNELRWYRGFRGDQSDRHYIEGIIGFGAGGQPYLDPEKVRKGSPFLDIANVKYVLVRNRGQLTALKNEGAFGRLSFAPSYIVKDSSAAIEALRSGGYDPQTAVALTEEPAEKPAPVAAADSGSSHPAFSVTWQRYSPNERVAQVAVPRDGFIRISEVYYPGWRISIDGEPVKVYQADGAWMAIYAPAGRHTINMQPASLFFGSATRVSLPLILLCLGYWTTVALRRVTAKAKQPAA
jgi:hypothetical protein